MRTERKWGGKTLKFPRWGRGGKGHPVFLYPEKGGGQRKGGTIIKKGNGEQSNQGGKRKKGQGKSGRPHNKEKRQKRKTLERWTGGHKNNFRW